MIILLIIITHLIFRKNKNEFNASKIERIHKNQNEKQGVSDYFLNINCKYYLNHVYMWNDWIQKILSQTNMNTFMIKKFSDGDPLFNNVQLFKIYRNNNRVDINAYDLNRKKIISFYILNEGSIVTVFLDKHKYIISDYQISINSGDGSLSWDAIEGWIINMSSEL
jgi:hypothetical protein